MRVLYRFRHVVLSLILLVGLYALLGFVVAPYLVKRYGVPAISEKLQRPVLLHDVQINPFALSIRLTGFEIQESDKRSMVGFDELFIDFEAIVSLFKQAYAFKEITVALPFVSARILPDKKLNLLGLLPPRPETPPPPDKTEKAAIPLVQVGLIQIQSGVLEFRDESKKKPVMIDVVPIEILLRNFSTKPGKENPYAFTAEFGQGETFSWNGTFSLEPLESEGTISLANIDLLTFWRGVQDRFKFDLRSAALDLDIRYTFDQRADPINFRINDGKLALRDFRLAAKGREEPLVSIPSVKIDEMRLDLASRDIKIGTIATGQGRIRGWLEPDGSVNYVPLFASTDSEDHEKPGPAPDTAAAATTQAEPWSIVVKTVQVNDYGATFEDRSLSPAAQIHIEDMRATVKDVRMPFAKPMNVSVGLTLNKTGHVETEGSVGLNPMRVDLRLHLSHIGLKPFQPYANRFVQADIDGGELHVDGAVRYAKAADEPLLAYDGKVSLTDFELADRASKKPAVSWDSLALTKMAVRLNPTSVKVGEIEWRKPSIQVVKDSDGTLNLSRIAGGTGAAPVKAPKSGGEGTKPAGKGTMPPISVDTVKLVKMDTTFVDQSIEPPVITGIQELSGTIKGLSSKELARAKVSLAGKVDKIAPMKIQGEINPLSETTYTDLKVLFDNVNLIAASPYAGKYAGFPITKGKLYLDLMYRVSKNQLHGENKVTIDQFTFGEKTDSPDATSLPVRLAVALLKDRHGKIEVDLPVRGDLNQPDFKYGRVLLDALVNLITKVAASPFAAIGNLVGGSGEELQYVAFEPGSAELTDADRGKLQTLEKALTERPALRLDVEGRADPELDGRALAQQKVEAAILARYEKTNRKAAASPPSADRRLELLNELYIQQFGKQPMKREEIAGGKTVERVMSGDEVKNELAATQKITEVELRQLAQNRAARIREFLVGQNHANQGSHEEPENQENAVAEAKQEDQGDQVKEGNQDGSSNQIKQEQAKQEEQDDHMSEDRVFLLDVELGGSGGGQVRCKLNLSGA